MVATVAAPPAVVTQRLSSAVTGGSEADSGRLTASDAL
jgi:hypothetical protein